jgi:hypothetical protein
MMNIESIVYRIASIIEMMMNHCMNFLCRDFRVFLEFLMIVMKMKMIV